MKSSSNTFFGRKKCFVLQSKRLKIQNRLLLEHLKNSGVSDERLKEIMSSANYFKDPGELPPTQKEGSISGTS